VRFKGLDKAKRGYLMQVLANLESGKADGADAEVQTMPNARVLPHASPASPCRTVYLHCTREKENALKPLW
jgi:hypothetical protein